MKNNEKRPHIKIFFSIFLPVFLLFSIIAMILMLQEVKSRTLLLKSKEWQHVETLRRIANDDLKAVVSDLFFLSVHPVLHQMIEGKKPATRQILSTIFKNFSGETKLYDQVRFLDEAGMERVRINFSQGSPNIVPDDKLQNKAKRYYFKDTIRLEPGHVFVSPFDLNVERGQIEQPYKPMIRFGIPVIDSKGNKHGIVLLNFFGTKLLNNLNLSSSRSLGIFMLIDSHGYWLKGLRPEDEWGFMFKDRTNLTFAYRHPESWASISTQEEGQFINDQGLYTFATIRPLGRNMLSSTGSIEAFSEVDARPLNKDLYWKVVSLVPKEKIIASKSILLLKWLPFYGLTILLIAFLSWGLSNYLLQRRQAMKERLHREKLQGVLELAGAACHELNQPMQAIIGYGDLLMLDLDADDPSIEKIEKIINQIERLGKITKKLANISKYETTDYLNEKIIDIEKSSL